MVFFQLYTNGRRPRSCTMGIESKFVLYNTFFLTLYNVNLHYMGGPCPLAYRVSTNPVDAPDLGLVLTRNKLREPKLSVRTLKVSCFSELRNAYYRTVVADHPWRID